MSENSNARYPIADCIKKLAEKIADPTINDSSYYFLTTLLHKLSKFQIGDYGKD